MDRIRAFRRIIRWLTILFLAQNTLLAWVLWPAELFVWLILLVSLVVYAFLAVLAFGLVRELARKEAAVQNGTDTTSCLHGAPAAGTDPGRGKTNRTQKND